MRGQRHRLAALAAATAAAAGASGSGAASSSPLGLQAQLHSLRDVVSALQQSAGGRLPGSLLSKTGRTVTRIMEALVCDGEDDVLLLVWGVAENRAALLALLTAATHELASDSAREDIKSLHQNLSLLLYILLNKGRMLQHPSAEAAPTGEQTLPPRLPPLLDTSLQALGLLIRMDLPKAISRLLAAVRDDLQQVRSLQLTVGVGSLLLSTHLLNQLEAADYGTGATCGQLAAELLRALADSGLVEHWVRTLLLLAQRASPPPPPPAVARSSASAAGGRGGGSNGIERRQRRRQQGPELQHEGETCTDTLGSFLKDFECMLLVADGPSSDSSRTASAGADLRARMLSGIRVVLSGPNLQYAQVAHVVSQLAAADGGSVYGMGGADALRVLPAWTEQLDGGRRRMVLVADGLVSAFRCWTVGFDLTPPVPLLPYGPREVYELSLRALRLVAGSAAAWAPRQRPLPLSSTAGQQGSPSSDPALAGATAAAAGPAGRTGPQQAAAGGSGPSGPVLPLRAADCASLTRAALSCAKAAVWAVAFGSVQGGGPQKGQAAAGSALKRTWEAAVPAVHGLIDLGEAGKLPRGPIIPDAALAVEAIELRLPYWPAGGLPPAPPPELSAALDAGYVPLLERLTRAQQRRAASTFDCCDPTHYYWLGQLYDFWPQLGRILAYGEPLEVASLLSTATKLLREVLRRCGIDIGGGGSDGGSCGNPASSSSPGEDNKHIVLSLRWLPLTGMLRWLITFATARRGAAAMAEGGSGSALPTGPAQAAAGAVATADATDAAAVGSTFVSPAACVATGGIEAPLGHHGSAAAPPPPPPAPPPQWSAGPTQQLLHMMWRAVRQWLPLASRAALSLLQQREQRGPGFSHALYSSCAILTWVPSLVHAYDMERHDGSGSGGQAVGSEAWRQLLLVDMRAGDLAGWTVRRCRGLLAAFGSGGDLEGWRDLLKNEILPAYDCLDAVFRSDLGPAVPPYDTALAELVAELNLAESAGRVSAEEVQDLRNALREAAMTHGSRPQGELPNTYYWAKVPVTAREVAALLRYAADLPPPGGAASLPVCSNPDCTNLEGDSEAGLEVQRRCRRCGVVAYCSSGCQWAHWQRQEGGHREQCAGCSGCGGGAGAGGRGGG